MSFQQFSREIMKYVRPIWYFHQKPCEEIRSVWIQYSQLKPEEKDVIDYDNEYSNSILCDWDAAYQILMRGIIKDNKSDIHENEINLWNYHLILKDIHKNKILDPTNLVF